MKDDVIEKPDPSRIIDYGVDVSIISLGERCWSRIFPEIFHLYNFKARDVRMPFDGCITKYGAVCEMIETDFAEVYDDLREGYLDIRTKYALYNHEKTLDLENFKIQMNKRINQFKNELKRCSESNSLVIFFLQHKHYPRKMISTIQEKYPNLNFKIYCVNKWVDPNNRKSKDTEFCRYLETKNGKGAEHDIEVLEKYFEIVCAVSKKKYDAELTWSRRAKHS
tara:strand:+ start:61 stop:729 length:669 start_codon:yes stop_codon:yes gene_type:complete